MEKKLRLANAKTGRVFLGVLSGIGNYTGIDHTILRIIWFASVWFAGLGLGAYFIAWLIMAIFAGTDE